MAAHTPKSSLERPSNFPKKGNRIKAMPLRTNMVAIATATWFAFDLIAGAIAAIALAPQMAVPVEIKMDIFFLVLSAWPKKTPTSIVSAMAAIVNQTAFTPSSRTCLISRLKPRPTTLI